MNDDYSDLIELGGFYILSQRYEEAIRILRRAEKIQKTDPKLYYNLGIAYEALNEKSDARDAFRLVLKLSPDNKSAQEHLDRLIEE
ncbi:MAG: tetratricopeptide repeat protein [candidate division WOR-3 bacterium]|jgi:Flp pilus assembly protein TadD|nr:MAG: tetratricopeptide repeat protein [candidate division WOR-3 bacterium]